MKIKVKIEKEYDAKWLVCKIGARYWEDATVNGVEDTEGELIPLRNGDYWEPIIDIVNGRINDWPTGTTASIHYKSCDDNIFSLFDYENNLIKKIDGYVIETMYPKENGYGDYVIMDIDKDGFIQDWGFKVEDFQNEED